MVSAQHQGMLNSGQMSSNMQNPSVIQGPPPGIMPVNRHQPPHAGPLVPNMCNMPRFPNRGTNQQLPFAPVGGAVAGMAGQPSGPPPPPGMHTMGGAPFLPTNMAGQQMMPPRPMHPYVGENMDARPQMSRCMNENMSGGSAMQGHDNMGPRPPMHCPMGDMGVGPPLQGHMIDSMGAGLHTPGPMSDSMGPPIQGHMGGPHPRGAMQMYPDGPGAPGQQQQMMEHRHDDQGPLGHCWPSQQHMPRNRLQEIPGSSVHDRHNTRDVDHRSGMPRDVDHRSGMPRDMDHRSGMPRDVDHRSGMPRDVDHRREASRDVDHRREVLGKHGMQANFTVDIVRLPLSLVRNYKEGH